ncbi:hypothetical protein PYCCODRAFT_1434580 [Trametes coccinea BRFM310]|uniref:Uncharacterized protein n=1 Tax=Trametes coccinea (strain BRFM310) TaxID=1353009 RepID=A0A1Y2IT86_TRAC3|nr:hypothetical protein PYCCODRAFT_1434580 [Trametes coccinea BRFM310]
MISSVPSAQFLLVNSIVYPPEYCSVHRSSGLWCFSFAQAQGHLLLFVGLLGVIVLRYCLPAVLGQSLSRRPALGFGSASPRTAPFGPVCVPHSAAPPTGARSSLARVTVSRRPSCRMPPAVVLQLFRQLKPGST